MPIFPNEEGVTFTAQNQDAVAAFDKTIYAYATFRRDIGQCLKEIFAADPDMVMALVLKGYFFHFMGLPALAVKARKCLTDAEARNETITHRERLHVQALSHWCRLDYRSAVHAWEAILLEHPRDFLALKLANYLHFYLGDSPNVRDSVARVLHAWTPAMPSYGLVMSLLAFGLEENGNYSEAERIARESVAKNTGDGWGIHGVAHVLESQDRNAEGIAWLQGLEEQWNTCNNFRYHLWWHRTLFHLDLEHYDEALSLYDTKLWDEKSDEYLDLCNDASLLLRLELCKVDVRDRWQNLFSKVKDRGDDHILCFVDAHFTMAYARRDRDAANKMLDSLRHYMESSPQTEAGVTKEVNYALCEAVAAYGAGDYQRTVDQLLPVRYKVRLIGGSSTQRDIFAQILIDAAIKSERFSTARALLSEHLQWRPNNGWARRRAATLHSGH